MLVLCLEGGVSMTAAFQRVTYDLKFIHPILGGEMSIIQREIQLGSSAGEGLKRFAERCGLNDMHNLASVWLQSERFGASMVKALRMHAGDGQARSPAADRRTGPEGGGQDSVPDASVHFSGHIHRSVGPGRLPDGRAVREVTA